MKRPLPKIKTSETGAQAIVMRDTNAIPDMSEILFSINENMSALVSSFREIIGKKELNYIKSLKKTIDEEKIYITEQTSILKKSVLLQDKMVMRLNDMVMGTYELFDTLSYFLIGKGRETEDQKVEKTLWDWLDNFLKKPYFDLFRSVMKSISSAIGSFASAIIQTFLFAGGSAIIASFSGFDAVRLLPRSMNIWLLMLGKIPNNMEKLQKIINSIKEATKKVESSGKSLVKGIKSAVKYLDLARHYLISIPRAMIRFFEMGALIGSVIATSYIKYAKIFEKIYSSLNAADMFLTKLDEFSLGGKLKEMKFFKIFPAMIEKIKLGLNIIMKPFIAIRKIIPFFEKIGDISSKGLGYIIDKFNAIEKVFMRIEGIAREFGAVGKFFLKFGSAFRGIAKWLLGPFSLALMSLWDFFSGFAKNWDKDIGIIARTTEGIISLIRGLLFEPLDIIKNVIAWLTSFISKSASDWIKENISFAGFYDKWIAPFIRSPIESMVNMILPAIGNIFTGSMESLRIFIDELGGKLGVDELTKKIGDTFTKIINFVTWPVTKTLEILKKFTPDSLQKQISDGFSNMIKSITDFFDYLFSKKFIRDLISGAVNATGLGKWISQSQIDSLLGFDPQKEKERIAQEESQKLYKETLSELHDIMDNLSKKNTGNTNILQDNSVKVITPKTAPSPIEGNISVSTEPPATTSNLLKRGLGTN